MTRPARLVAAAFLAALMLPVTALPALASTQVVDAPLPAPTGLAPADSLTTYPQTVRKDVFLTWNAVAGATAYQVEIGTDDTWSDTPALTLNTTNTSVIVPVGSLPYATYTWRVAALKGTVLGHWTSESTNSQNAAQFTHGWRARPTQLSPDDGAIVEWPDFSWTSVAEAGQYAILVSDKPLLVAASSETVPAGAFKCLTTRTRLTPFDEGNGTCKMDLEAGKTYYWTVSGLDVSADGGTEATLPTPVRSFTLPDAPAPPPADQPLPVPATQPTTAGLDTDPDHLCTITDATTQRALCSDVPTIRWDAITDADHYYLLMSTDSFFQNTVDVVKTKGTSWTSTEGLPEMSPTQSMYYAVQACNADDFCTGYTPDGPSFRKVTPALTNLNTPASTGVAVFTWQSLQSALAAAEKPAGTADTATQDAATYHLQIARADHPSFDTVVIDKTVDGVVPISGDAPHTTNPTWFSDSTLGDGDYVWRVQPVDATGHKLPYSAGVSFSRDATPPSLIAVSPNKNVAAKSPLKLQFSEDVTGLSASSVVLDPAVPATLTVTGPSTATLTPTKAMTPGATYTVRVLPAVKDRTGNSAVPDGPSLTVNPLADDTSPAIAYSSGWRPFSATNAIGGRYYRSTPTASYHPSASLTFYGTGVAYYSCLAPANGYVDVYVDGTRRVRKNLYRAYSGCGLKLFSITKLTKGTHTIKVVGVGAKASYSKGTNVAVDAFNVAP